MIKNLTHHQPSLILQTSGVFVWIQNDLPYEACTKEVLKLFLWKFDVDTEEHTLQSTITEERATTMAANQENAEATEQRVQLANRPKRPVIKPSYLRDYV